MASGVPDTIASEWLECHSCPMKIHKIHVQKIFNHCQSPSETLCSWTNHSLSALLNWDISDPIHIVTVRTNRNWKYLIFNPKIRKIMRSSQQETWPLSELDRLFNMVSKELVYCGFMYKLYIAFCAVCLSWLKLGKAPQEYHLYMRLKIKYNNVQVYSIFCLFSPQFMISWCRGKRYSWA